MSDESQKSAKLIMNSDIIIGAISRLARKKPEDVQAYISLGTLGLTKSFGLSALRSIIEVEGKTKLSPLNINMTVKDVIDMAIDGTIVIGKGNAKPEKTRTAMVRSPESFAGTAKPQSLAMTKSIGLGMDMQEIDTMPIAFDYRTHEFYATHFSPTEIATAILRPDPRAHFCGIFCAKEAAKKSNNTLLNLRMSNLIVRYDAEGRPILNLINSTLSDKKFQFILSITHTSQFAAATCMTIWDIE